MIFKFYGYGPRIEFLPAHSFSCRDSAPVLPPSASVASSSFCATETSNLVEHNIQERHKGTFTGLGISSETIFCHLDLGLLPRHYGQSASFLSGQAESGKKYTKPRSQI